MKCLKALKSERGSVESAMILIPLLTLFLIGMQIATAAHARNMERSFLQDDVSKRAISGQFNDSDEFVHINSGGDGETVDLLVRHQSLGHLSFGVELDGVAVIENQR